MFTEDFCELQYLVHAEWDEVTVFLLILVGVYSSQI